MKHEYKEDEEELKHDLEIREGTQIYCKNHGIEVAAFNSEELIVFGGTYEDINLDRENYEMIDGGIE